MAQWRERSPLTNVSRVRFPDPASYVGCVFSCRRDRLRHISIQSIRSHYVFLLAAFVNITYLTHDN